MNGIDADRTSRIVFRQERNWLESIRPTPARVHYISSGLQLREPAKRKLTRRVIFKGRNGKEQTELCLASRRAAPAFRASWAIRYICRSCLYIIYYIDANHGQIRPSMQVLRFECDTANDRSSKRQMPDKLPLRTAHSSPLITITIN